MAGGRAEWEAVGKKKKEEENRREQDGQDEGRTEESKERYILTEGVIISLSINLAL